MNLSGKSVLFLLCLMCFIVPSFAIPATDLTAYTLTGNYVTPSYGLFLQSNYGYYKDGIYWSNEASEGYEYYGYYPIKNSLTNDSLTYSGEIKSSLGGTVYVCVDVSQYITPNPNYCEAVTTIAGSGLWQPFGGTLDLNTYLTTIEGGVLRYYYKLVHIDGSSVYSNYYTVFWNIDNLYNNYRLISLVSSNNLSEGVVTITLNSTITKELNDSGCIQYDNDGLETTLSGTLSCLLFTDSSKQKAYPYYIDTFWGGFYNYSRYNLSLNTTTIKIFINENETNKGIYMYYNISGTNTGVLMGRYNDSDGRRDENNNPFVIHQVFNDQRWNQSFFTNNIMYIQNLMTYTRGSHIRIGQLNNYYKFKYNISDFVYNMEKPSGTPTTVLGNLLINTSTSILTYFWSTGNDRLLNTSGINVNTTYGNGAHRYLSIKNGILCENAYCLNESAYTDFGNLSFSHNPWANFTYSRNLNNISTTNTIYTPTNTTPINLSNLSISSISFNSLTPTKTNINDISIHLDVITNRGGNAICQEDEYINQTIGTVAIPAITSMNTYNLIFDYRITNETLFNSLSQIHVKCTFTDTDGVIYTDTYLILIGNEKLFLDNINPLHYTNYANSNILASMNMSYNYSTANHTTLMIYGLMKLNCYSIYNGKCIKYDIDETITLGVTSTCLDILGICVPYTTTGILNPTTFSSSTIITNNVESNRCYLMGYALQINNVTDSTGNYTNNLLYKSFCVNASENPYGNGTGGGGTPSGGNIPDISAAIKNAIIGASLQCYTNFTGNASQVLLKPQCATGSAMYQLAYMGGRNPEIASIVLAFLIVFWSFPFLAIAVGIYLIHKTSNTIAGLGTIFILLIFFMLAGFSNLDILNVLVIAAFGIILWLKSKG